MSIGSVSIGGRIPVVSPVLATTANTPLASYATRLLVEFPNLGLKIITSQDEYISNVLYERRLLNEPEVSKETDNIYWGISKARDISLRLSNADKFFSSIDLRNQPVILKRWEPMDSTAITFELYGIVTDANVLDEVDVQVSVQDQLALQPALPRTVLTNDLFAAARPNVAFRPTRDLGKALPLGLGYAKKVFAVYVYGDTTANTYDYIIGAGPIESNNTNKSTTVNVYRGKVLVSNAEYTVYDGLDNTYVDSRGVSYAWIRFTKEQRDFSGSLYDIHVDYHGLKLGGTTAERNPIRQIQNIISNSLWGLGLTVDTAAFDAAVLLSPPLKCDGPITAQRDAQYILNDLLAVARAKIEKSSTGAWTIRVDSWRNTTVASFGAGDGYHENIVEISENRRTAAREAIKSIIIKYGWNEWTGAFAYTLTRQVLAAGEEKIIELPLVLDSETADRHACYLQRSAAIGDKKVGIKVGMEGRTLKDYDPISISVPRLSISGVHQVQSVSRSLNAFVVGCRNYTSEMYNYVAAPLPTAAGSDDLPDYSNTPPAAPTNFTLVSSSTRQGNDGTTTAYCQLSAVIPSANASEIKFGFKKYNVAEPYTYVSGALDAGSTWKGKIEGLVPGMAYDFVAVARNTFGKQSAPATLTNQVAPGDTTAPATVTGVTLTAHYKSWTAAWTKNTESDVREYQVQLATDSGFVGIVYDQKVEGTLATYASAALSYGTLYCRVKAIDFSGNPSASWSATASATSSQTGAGDIGTSVVGTTHVAPDAITTAKIAPRTSQSAAFTAGANGGYALVSFTHSIGKIPLVSFYTNAAFLGLTVYPYAFNSSTMSFCIVNNATSSVSGTLYVDYI